ncbi:hypothetical protein H6784_01245 [Candidatus Nomurabacteria bacterium]|nr:hypothetical protein [Candidatus Nomurabacteria bacterium]
MESLSEKRERVISLTRQEQENERFDPDWAKELREEIDILEAEIAESEKKAGSPSGDSARKPNIIKTAKETFVTDRATVVSRTNSLLDMLRKDR